MWSGEAEREDCSNHKGSQLILRGGRVIKYMVTAFLRMKCNIGPIKKVEVVRTWVIKMWTGCLWGTPGGPQTQLRGHKYVEQRKLDQAGPRA